MLKTVLEMHVIETEALALLSRCFLFHLVVLILF